MTATLNGQANPNGNATTGWFRYATANPGACNDTFGTRVPGTTGTGTSLGTGTTPQPYSQALTSLAPGHDLLLLRDREQLAGDVVRRRCCRSPRRSRPAPGVTTTAATSITGTGATLNGRRTRTAARPPAGSATRRPARAPATTPSARACRPAAARRSAPATARSPISQAVTGARLQARPTTSARSPRTAPAPRSARSCRSPRRSRPNVTTDPGDRASARRPRR